MKKSNVKLIAYFLVVIILTVNIAKAQDQKVIPDSLYSEILKEERQLHVVLPKNYNPASTDKYEIVYCLDDISDFLTMEWGMLQWEGFIPKNMIMVGITNPKPNGVDMRDRDFTPSKTSNISGGAEKFLSFFKTELIPFISNKYKAANNGNVLYGGSLGGLFVMYTFLNDPQLFTSYIAVDPSLWWDNFHLNKVAAHTFDSVTSYHNTLFIVGRKGNAYKEMGTYGIDSLLHVRIPAGLDWICIPYTNETHYSTNFKGFWEGLKFSYGGFYASTGGYATSRKIAIKPKRGIVLNNVPFKLICYNLMPEVYLHYTTDGMIPTKASAPLVGDETPITLQSDSKIIVKSIGVRQQYDRCDTGYFTVGSVFNSVPQPINIKAGGLHYAYYEGTWNARPKLNHVKPSKTGIADKGFDINKFNSNKSFACVMNGYIQIHKPGYYIFEMGDGNDYTKVYINNQLILGNHFVKGDGDLYMIPLEKGFYPICIDYFHKKGDGDLEPIYLKPEGVEDTQISADMLYSERN